MPVRRALATTLVSTLVASATAIGTIPASAGATTTGTRIVSGSSTVPWISASGYQDQPGAVVTGGTLSLWIDVETTDGVAVYDGTLTVQRLLAGATQWQTVATSDTAWLYDSVPAQRNATYRVLYSGNDTYQPSQASAAVPVQKRLALTPESGRRLGLAGKITPRGKNKVVVLKKQGRRWKKFKTVTSNRKGRFFASVTAPRRRGAKYYWKVQIAGSRTYAVTRSAVYYTTRYRSAARG